MAASNVKETTCCYRVRLPRVYRVSGTTNKRANVGMVKRALHQFRAVEIGADTRTVTNIRRPRKIQQTSGDPCPVTTDALIPEQAHRNIAIAERTNDENTSGLSSGGASSITTPRNRIRLAHPCTPFPGCDNTYSGRISGGPCEKTMTDFRHPPMLAEPDALSVLVGDLCREKSIHDGAVRLLSQKPSAAARIITATSLVAPSLLTDPGA